MDRAAPVSGAGAVVALLGLVALGSAGRPAPSDALHRTDAGLTEGADGGAPGSEAAAESAEPSQAGRALLEGEPVDLNRARAADLRMLPRIGPALAARILADRRANGAYADLQELTRVRGIGPKTVEGLRGLAVAGEKNAGKTE